RASYEEWGCGWTPLIDDARFIASGTEPDWTLEVSADTAVMSTPERTEWGGVERLEGTAPAGWTVEGRVGEAGFVLEITPEPCTNAMTGGWTPLTAHLTRAGTEWRGCAFRGVL
ncbi:MAG: hypothetical protein RQ745_13715, partial [Longimicrobiales bacterium]|nr:hypothetical protein [Longimicrobiales bacterium]